MDPQSSPNPLNVISFPPMTILAPLSQALAGRYRIDREAGSGGMATVYAARDLRHERDVAIKVLRPELAAAIGADRFLAEIRTTAQLHHPLIVPLYDSGDAGGFLYYVMPFVEGESLRARLEEKGKLPVDEAVRIAREVADALAFAHAQGVVHRDIKPDNILLQSGHALVMDFGIARALGGTDATRLTIGGHLVGTPAYMSPEQASGDEEVDHRSDQYGLASMLFEMLAGEPPFTGSLEAVLLARFTRGAPRVSSRRDTVPFALDAALRRALSRRPDERFDTIGAFAAALAPDPEAMPAAPDTSLAVLPFRNMSADPENEYFSDGITEEIMNVLSRVDGLRVAARTSTFAFKERREDLREIADRLNVGTILEGSVRKSGDRIRITVQLTDARSGYQLWSERYDRELTDVFAVQDEIAGAVAERLRVTLSGDGAPRGRSRAANAEAYDLYLKGRVLLWRRGRSLLEAIPVFEKALELEPDNAEATALLSSAFRLLAVYGLRSPADVMPVARETVRKALALDPDLPDAYTTQAAVALAWDYNEEEAFRAWTRALELDPRHTQARCERASWGISFQAGRFDEGIAEIRKALADDPLNSWAAGMLSINLAAAGKLPEAVDTAHHAAELDSDSFLARWILIQSLNWAGRHEEALSLVEPVLLMSGRNPWALAPVAVARGGLGDRDGADAIFRELTARARVEYVQTFWVATAAAAAGHMNDAMALAVKAVDERDSLVQLMRYLPDWEPVRKHPDYGRVLAQFELRRKASRRDARPA